MKIIFTDTFITRLEEQIRYIALNNPQNARQFKNQILTRIKEIPQNPYIYRKSVYFENEKIRDLIFKGYTIVFRISDTSIEVFGFLKHQKDPGE